MRARGLLVFLVLLEQQVSSDMCLDFHMNFAYYQPTHSRDAAPLFQQLCISARRCVTEDNLCLTCASKLQTYHPPDFYFFFFIVKVLRSVYLAGRRAPWVKRSISL